MDIIYNICKSLHATANAAKKKKKKIRTVNLLM